MELGNITEKAIPWIDKFREILMKGSEYIAKAFELDVGNTYFIVLILVSAFISKKIFNIFFAATSERGHYWILLGLGIFYVLKYM